MELLHGVLLALQAGKRLVISGVGVAAGQGLVLRLKAGPCQARLALQEGLHVALLRGGLVLLLFGHACEAIHGAELILRVGLLLGLLQGPGKVLTRRRLLLLSTRHLLCKGLVLLAELRLVLLLRLALHAVQARLLLQVLMRWLLSLELRLVP